MIHIKNLIIFLAAITNIHIPDSEFREIEAAASALPGSHIAQDGSHRRKNTYVSFDLGSDSGTSEAGFITMNESQRENSRKKFIELAMNKRQYNAYIRKYANSASPVLTKPVPNINSWSNYISMNAERMNKPIYEMLNDRGEEYEKKNKMRIKVKRDCETDGCTFKPYVSPKSK